MIPGKGKEAINMIMWYILQWRLVCSLESGDWGKGNMLRKCL